MFPIAHACILQKSLKTYYGLLLLAQIHLYLPFDVPGAFCVWEKEFNLNFSEVLTKREENPRVTVKSFLTKSLFFSCRFRFP